jgi:hypothetical protein
VVAEQYDALGALNAVFVAFRSLAYDKADQQLLAELLDMAEYLPQLLADERDRTTQFREVLIEMTERCEYFRRAVDRFDALGT